MVAVQYVFGAQLALPDGEETQHSIDVASAELVEWASERLDIKIGQWTEGRASSHAARATWSEMDGEAGSLRQLSITHEDSSGMPWSWHVDAWIGRTPSASWLRTRVGLEPRRDDSVIDVNVSVGSPRFMQAVAGKLGLAANGLELARWHTIAPRMVTGYVDFLTSPTRTLPVVAVTRSGNGGPMLRPELLVRRLTGVAHVVAIEPAATYAVSDTVTPPLSCFGGAVRLYWPGFSTRANRLDHPLWLPRGAAVVDTERVADEIVGLVGRGAALVYSVPRLATTLRRERSEAEFRVEQDRRAAQAQELSEAVRLNEGGLSSHEFAEWSKEFDLLSEQVEGYERRVSELEAELEQAKSDHEQVRQSFQLAWAASSSSGSDDSEESDADAVVGTVRDAVDVAAGRCSHLIFLQSAFESADGSQFANPQQVLEDLLLLDDVAGQWAAGTMGGDFRTAFNGRHDGFRSGISQIASTKYRQDYQVSYDGKSELMGPHLRRGVGAPPTILRIYWVKDDDAGKLVVGHVGRKLRDDSNKN